LLWFNEHAMELEVFKRYRGRFVAVSEGEIFVGDSRQEVERLAREAHPEDIPHVQYIPKEKVYRIYACQRQVASFFITAKDETNLTGTQRPQAITHVRHENFTYAGLPTKFPCFTLVR
jgi:hypothetical protein